jgi:phage tail-like protein
MKGNEPLAESASRTDPLASFNFIVDIKGMRAGFAEVTGLTTNANLVEYREGKRRRTAGRLPETRKYTNISLKRGYTLDGKRFRAWRKRVLHGKTQRLGGTITLVNEARRPLQTWEFSQGWPSKWVGADLNAQSNDVVIEEMELQVEGLVLQS